MTVHNDITINNKYKILRFKVTNYDHNDACQVLKIKTRIIFFLLTNDKNNLIDIIFIDGIICIIFLRVRLTGVSGTLIKDTKKETYYLKG